MSLIAEALMVAVVMLDELRLNSAASTSETTARRRPTEADRIFSLRLFLLHRRVRFSTEDDFDVVYMAVLGQRNGVGIN
jgi:hypothetical protein